MHHAWLVSACSLAAGIIMKLTNATFSALDMSLDSISRILSFLGLSFSWRFQWDTRAAINRFLDNIFSAVNTFFDVSPCESAQPQQQQTIL